MTSGRPDPLANLPGAVRIAEVGPRDGLQNEPGRVATEDKIAFVDALTDAGLRCIEVSSFVRPSRIPQLADAEAVFAGIRRREGVRYVALVPNMRGLERARAARVDTIAVFTGATESFVRRNINMTVRESLDRFREVVSAARSEGMDVRGYVSVCFGCPYEGPVDPQRVVDIAAELLDMGCYEVSLGDTVGVAVPPQIVDMAARLEAIAPLDRFALHLHDTRGVALANILMALQCGFVAFDAAAGGLGGCPYAPGASGNVATEDVLYMLGGLGIETGVDLDAVVEATRLVAEALGRLPPGRYARAVLGTCDVRPAP